jgi:hypothetical protein
MNGQLGDGTLVDKRTPVQVTGLVNCGSHFCGRTLLSRGKIGWYGMGMGQNSNFQLGDHTQINRSTPIQTAGLTNAVAVAGGAYHSRHLNQTVRSGHGAIMHGAGW